MKLYAPDYYREFKCIAEKCKHNCCIGWEIDIDKDTYEYYTELEGKIGLEIKSNIVKHGECFCFKLTEDERCPFLDEKNLCKIISELGEDGLCNICYDHPRFRNFFETREEIGLGLCCEEACRIIVTKKEAFKIVQADFEEGYNEVCECDTEKECEFFKLRDNIFELLYNENASYEEAVLKILKACKIKEIKNFKSECAEIYKGLERLDKAWDKKLEMLNMAEKEYTYDFEMCFKNLFAYFVFRHTAESLCDNRLKERICFCVMSVYVIKKIFISGSERNIKALLEIARMYSAEVEYSEENTQKLIEYFCC